MAATIFERRNIWTLSDADPWHPTIRWFADAIDELRGRDGANRADPTSWGHLAAIHGTTDPEPSWPAGAKWNQCQHHTWFFLPWHRIYLHHFEKIVRDAVAGLGGPSDWALPFWDYSVPGRRALPPAFLSQQRPNGDPNPLFTTHRSSPIKNGQPLPWNRREWNETLDMTRFVIRARPGAKAFGGPRTGWFHGTEASVDHPQGEAELYPHDEVHGLLGGWMGAFQTAPLDPVFWLHHANIDRLWEAWLRRGGGRANPDQGAWLDRGFEMGSGAWTTSMTVGDVLDTSASPLQYRYGGVPVAPAPAMPGVAAAAPATPEETMDEGPPPELVGATEAPLSLGGTPNAAAVGLREPVGPVAAAVAAEAREPRIYLAIEHVTGTRSSAPTYLVHVNLPPGADPEERDDLLAGSLPMFGVREASVPGSEHEGGLSFTFDITDVVERLRLQEAWDPERLEVTFTPVWSEGDPAGDVSIGRISVYYE